jgi:hypothetical protein
VEKTLGLLGKPNEEVRQSREVIKADVFQALIKPDVPGPGSYFNFFMRQCSQLKSSERTSRRS